MGWQIHDASYVIIHQTHFYPFLYLTLQDLQNGIPHDPVTYNEIFHEYVFLSLLQILQKTGPEFLSDGEILCTDILPGLSVSIPADVGHLPSHRRILFRNLLQNLLTLRQCFHYRFFRLFHILVHFPRNNDMSEKKEHDSTEQREQQNRNNPGNFDGRTTLFV